VLPVAPEEKALVQTWIPLSLADRLRQQAVANERSLAAEARLAIKAYLENTEGALAGPSETSTSVTALDHAGS
jgi:hypothetical protein